MEKVSINCNFKIESVVTYNTIYRTYIFRRGNHIHVIYKLGPVPKGLLSFYQYEDLFREPVGLWIEEILDQFCIELVTSNPLHHTLPHLHPIVK